MTDASALRARAEAAAAPLPALLAAAERLANATLGGEHGRKRAGSGDSFWQYRMAQHQDPANRIDWRRSARSDQNYVQDKEWQIAQSVMFWVDRSAAMQFASDKSLPTKADRAALLALACAILLDRGGERVGLCGADLPVRRGGGQLQAMAAQLLRADHSDYGMPQALGLTKNGQAVFVSDFLGDLGDLEAALAEATAKGVSGVLLQILDPQEESFPFDGRTIFESMSGGITHQTRKAADLRDRYLQRLAAHKDQLHALARASGWQALIHHTDQPATQALLQLYHAVERPR